MNIKTQSGKLNSSCYSRIWGRDVGLKFFLFVFVFGVNQEKQGESKILLCKLVKSFS